MIQESENVGVQTAVELDRQREQLEKTKNNLEKIDSNLKDSQKDINSMKSIFYRMKYAFSSKKKVDPVVAELPSSSIDDMKPVKLSPAEQEDRYRNHPTSRMRTNETTTKTVNDEYETQLDDHLDQISDGLSRLKELALNIGQEVETQNEILDDIGTKMNGVDIKIEGQNKEVTKLLGRKEPENSNTVTGVSSVTSASTTFKILKFFK